jgi:PAS domain S-box-containing protein
VENAVEGIFQSTPDGRFVTANPALARILGYDSPDELIRVAANLPEHVYVDPTRRQELLRRLEAAGFVSRFEVQARRRDGSTVSLSLSVRAIRDAGGVTQRHEGIVEDVATLTKAQLNRV